MSIQTKRSCPDRHDAPNVLESEPHLIAPEPLRIPPDHVAVDVPDLSVHTSMEMDDDELVQAQARSFRAWQRLWLRICSIDPDDLVRLLLVIIAIAAFIWVLWYSWSSLLPFQIGVVLTYLLFPLVNWLNRWLPRWVAVVLVLSGGLIAISSIIWVLVPALISQLNSLLQSLPTTAQFEQWIASLEEYISTLPEGTRIFINEGFQQALIMMRNNLVTYIRSMINFLVNTGLSVVSTVTFLIGFVVIPFWLFFVLMDLQTAAQTVDRMVPRWLRADFWAVLRITDRIISRYFRGQLLLGIIIAVAVYSGLTIMKLSGVEGIQYELLLALIAGFTELIPIIGPILGAIPAVIVGLLHSWQTGLAIALMFLIIQQIEGNILVPRVVGDSVNIHPALVMILIIVLTPLGIIWLILAVPMTAVIRDIYRYVYGRFGKPRRPAGLLPGEPFPPVAETVTQQPVAD